MAEKKCIESVGKRAARMLAEAVEVVAKLSFTLYRSADGKSYIRQGSNAGDEGSTWLLAFRLHTDDGGKYTGCYTISTKTLPITDEELLLVVDELKKVLKQSIK